MKYTTNCPPCQPKLKIHIPYIQLFFGDFILSHTRALDLSPADVIYYYLIIFPLVWSLGLVMAKKRFMDDFEEYEVTEDHHPSRGGLIIRSVFYSLILLINAALIFRVCMAEDPGSVSSLEINDNLRAAYAESEKDFQVYTQTVYDMYTSDGIYYATGLYLCPAADELQIAIRYNVRTADAAVKWTAENETVVALLEQSGLFPISKLSGQVLRDSVGRNITLSESKMREGDYFTFRLTDDFGNYYTAASDKKVSRILYVYHKLTFDGLTDENTNFYVEIYPLYNGTPDYNTVLGRMKVYSIDRSSNEYKLSGKEKSQLS